MSTWRVLMSILKYSNIDLRHWDARTCQFRLKAHMLFGGCIKPRLLAGLPFTSVKFADEKASSNSRWTCTADWSQMKAMQ
jgi:hypothetical protein